MLRWESNSTQPMAQARQSSTTPARRKTRWAKRFMARLPYRPKASHPKEGGSLGAAVALGKLPARRSPAFGQIAQRESGTLPRHVAFAVDKLRPTVVKEIPHERTRSAASLADLHRPQS